MTRPGQASDRTIPAYLSQSLTILGLLGLVPLGLVPGPGPWEFVLGQTGIKLIPSLPTTTSP